MCRIRNSHLAEHFLRFDADTNSFVPNELKAFEFPADQVTDLKSVASDERTDRIARDVTSGLQKFAWHLKEIILGGRTSSQELNKMKLILFFHDRLAETSNGNVVPFKERLSFPVMPPQKLAVLHIHSINNLTMEIGELLWQRRRSMESENSLKFGLGDVVQHKIYGFRGVVVAWDPKPIVDVSRWDGLQHIKDPHTYPFYHIIPDQNDCVAAFGGERPSRYVCEENLIACPHERRKIDVDLEPEWEFDRSTWTYVPPDDLKVSRMSH